MKTGLRIIFLLLLLITISIETSSAVNATGEMFYPQFWLSEGVAQYTLNNFDRALTLLDISVSQDPTLASAWMWRSRILTELGRTQEAAESLAKAKELDPLIDDPYRKKVGSLADVTITPVPTARPQQSEDKLKEMIQSDVDLSKKPDPTGPDMVMYDLQANVNPETKQVEISAVIGNEGIKPSRDFFITFFGSYNTPVTYQDSPIGFYLVDNLLPGTKKTIAGYFPISQIPSGDYYIGAYIDPNNQIMEISEDNNGKTAPAKVSIPELNTSVGLQLGSTQLAVPNTPVVEPISTKKPDLIIDSISGQTSATLGDEILINTTVRNAGDADAGEFRVMVYLSRDSVMSDDDMTLGYGDVPDLGIGKSRQGTAVATIPLNVAPGVYYLIAQADSQNKITEKNKGNNVLAQDASITIIAPPLPGNDTAMEVTPIPTVTPLTVQPEITPIAEQTMTPSISPVSPESDELLPDLVVLNITSDTAGKPGGMINVTTLIRNNGTASAGLFNVSLFLSADTIIKSDEDLLVGLGQIEDLPSGTQRSGDAAAPIPSTIKPGIYYFGLIADSSFLVNETDEDNNSGYSKSPILIKS